MSYKTILVNLETDKCADKVLPVAIRLALAHEAHLIGIHVMPGPAHPVFGYEIPSEVYDSMRAAAQSRADAMHKKFEHAVGAEVAMSAEWRTVESRNPDITNTLLEHVRRADLVITAQVDQEHPDKANRELAGTLVLEGGRPVLVVPYAGEVRHFGELVFVAWNGSRESARAVFDALPLLQTAKEVRLYGVNPDTGDAEHPMAPGAELATTLARHGVNAVVENVSGSRTSVGNELLSRAADRGSDLLIMGGYGRSRARERIFGGATRDILTTMTIPVLMSH